jgi:DNA polymerase III alpha subunit
MILSRQPLRHLSPIQTSANGVRQIQFAKDDVESLGLIKFDVLGLRMLSVISEAQQMIRQEQAREQAREEARQKSRTASTLTSPGPAITWRSVPASPPQALGARRPQVMPMRASAFGRGGITVDPSRRIDLPRSVPHSVPPLPDFPPVPEEPDASSTCTVQPPSQSKPFNADELPESDDKTYKLIRSGATLGVFQIESPGQWHLLARSQPQNFDDLVAQVALFRPGPLQGNMVHPYVARRRGLSQVIYPHPSLEFVLRDTYGVILFQEQVLEVAHLFAGMPLQEADEFRRLMSRFRDRGEMEAMREAFVASAIATHAASPHPVGEALAHAVFDLVALFVGYGFCRSHAAAFARTVYQSAYLKAHFPAAYMAAVMEHRPGFYPLQTLLEEARHLGVQVLPPCLHRSGVKYLLEEGKIRVPFSQVKTVSPECAALIVLERALSDFSSLEESVHRLSFLDREQWENLARSGALQDFGARRDVLWRVRLLLRQRPHGEQLQLDFAGQEGPVDVPLLSLLPAHERIAWDFETQNLTTGVHPLALHRANLKRLGAATIEELREHRDGDRVLVAGAVISRQRPPTAKGMSFLILEDETGRLPTAAVPQVWDRFEALRRAPALLVEGRLEDGMSGQASTCRTLEDASTYRSVLIGRVWSLETTALCSGCELP